MSTTSEATQTKFSRVASIFAALLCVLVVMALVGGTTQSFWKGLLLGGGMCVATVVTLILLALRMAKTIMEADAKGETVEEPSLLQFRISTLMILITLQGFYLAAIREVVLAMASNQASIGELVGLTFFWTTLLGLGMFLPWLILTEYVLRLLATLVHTPMGQRLVRTLFRRRAP